MAGLAAITRWYLACLVAVGLMLAGPSLAAAESVDRQQTFRLEPGARATTQFELREAGVASLKIFGADLAGLRVRISGADGRPLELLDERRGATVELLVLADRPGAYEVNLLDAGPAPLDLVVGPPELTAPDTLGPDVTPTGPG